MFGQILFHEEGNVGMMEETAIAISPGLYSLLAIEKTEVAIKVMMPLHLFSDESRNNNYICIAYSICMSRNI